MPGSLGGKVVFLIENDLDIQALVQEYLEFQGMIVHKCNGYVDAVSVLKAFQPDLILCELYLLNGNGYDLLRNLRAWELAQGKDPIPAIAMSMLNQREHEPIALKTGFQAYLQKPFGIVELHTTIERVLAFG